MALSLKRVRLSSNNSVGNSRSVTSNQTGIHPDLETTVRRHLEEPYRKPIAEQTQNILDQIEKKHIEIGGDLILDSGCGTGVSSYNLAEQFPNDLIVGVDQSDFRLSKNKSELEKQLTSDNILLFRANIIDIWLLMAKNNWKLGRHYVFYPNPWPKKKHLQRRWHGHPIFPTLIKLGGQLELRSNWKMYVDEFSEAIEIAIDVKEPVEPFVFVEKAVTPFEKKYQLSGQDLYCYQINLSNG